MKHRRLVHIVTARKKREREGGAGVPIFPSRALPSVLTFSQNRPHLLKVTLLPNSPIGW
jgi:hypothetical protein